MSRHITDENMVLAKRLISLLHSSGIEVLVDEVAQFAEAANDVCERIDLLLPSGWLLVQNCLDEERNANAAVHFYFELARVLREQSQ